MLRVAINGYGRIGRALVRALFDRDLEHRIHLCAINDLGDPATLTHLTRFDSTFGRFAARVSQHDDVLQIDGQSIHLLREREVQALRDFYERHGFKGLARSAAIMASASPQCSVSPRISAAFASNGLKNPRIAAKAIAVITRLKVSVAKTPR